MRPSWDGYYIAMAYLVATRATCDRKHVGAVLVDEEKRVVATGYNGAPSGMPHCDDVGHELKEIEGRMSCVRTLHAESNAIDYAGRQTWGCTLYTTVIPCYDCAKRIVNAGIRRVVYDEFYQSRNTEIVEDYFEKSPVKLQKWISSNSDPSHFIKAAFSKPVSLTLDQSKSEDPYECAIKMGDHEVNCLTCKGACPHY